jgi:hypothetical protein
MSDGGRARVSLAVEVWKSSQKLIAKRSAVRSIAWLGGWRRVQRKLDADAASTSHSKQARGKEIALDRSIAAKIAKVEPSVRHTTESLQALQLGLPLPQQSNRVFDLRDEIAVGLADVEAEAAIGMVAAVVAAWFSTPMDLIRAKRALSKKRINVEVISSDVKHTAAHGNTT